MAHGGFLRQHSDDPELASHIMHDYTQAGLDEQTRGMLDFAVKLTKDPSGNRKADIERLRSLGLDDQQILSTVLITCVFKLTCGTFQWDPARKSSNTARTSCLSASRC